MEKVIEEQVRKVDGPSPLFKAVMHSRDLAPLVLRHLDFKALLAYSHTYRLGYQVAKYYQWGKQLIDQNLIAYYLLDHVAFQNRFSDAVLRNLYLTLRNNRRFAISELTDVTVNPILYATYGEGGHIPWYLAALLGRIDIILDLVKTNPHYSSFKDKHIISLLISATKHRVAYYLVFAQQFDKLSFYFNKGYITKDDVRDTKIREDLIFAGGCAGVMDIRERLQAIYGCDLKIIKREIVIIASGLMEGGHLRSLVKLMVDQRLSVVEILGQHSECLHHTAENGHRETVNYILSEIERYNILNSDNDRARFVLLEVDSKGRSLLHYFAYHGWQAEFKKLTIRELQNSIQKGRSKLSYISRKDKKKYAKSISLCPTQLDNDSNTPMHFALMGGKLSMAKFCQDHGWGNFKDITDQYHNNALGIVITAKQNHLIEPLIRQYGVDWKCVNDFDHNLLLWCAARNNFAAFTELSQMKMESTPLFNEPLNSKTRSGRTLAHLAARQAHISFLRQLKADCKKKGGKIYDQLFKSVDQEGNSILHELCKNDYYFGIFEIFIEEFGCNPRQENHEKQNGVHIILLDKDRRPEIVWETIAKIVHKYGHDLLDKKIGDRKSIREIAKEAGREHLFEESLCQGNNLAQ